MCAIDLVDEYGALADGTDLTNYPFGKFKNTTTPGGTDGTPFEKAWPNDWVAYFQKLLDVMGVTPSGSPDTVQNSQYYDAMIAIALNNTGAGSIRSFNLVADMVAATDLNVGDLVITRGYLAQGVGSAIYRVVASGTGAVDGGEFINLDTHQAQLIPDRVVRASQYGAVGDGSTDDSTAIQALFDAFDSVEIDTSSKVNTGLVIGDNQKKVLISNALQGAATAVDILSVSTIDGPFCSIEFEGNGVIQGDGATAAQVGISVSSSGVVRIFNARIDGCLNRGIELSGAFDCVIQGGFISSTTQSAGIYVGASSSTFNNRIVNVNVSDNVVGILLDGPHHNHLSGIMAKDCTDAGIKLENGASYNDINGVHCADQTNAAGAGIHIIEESNDNIITGAICTGNTGAGILIEGDSIGNETARNRVIGAVCFSNGVDGIYEYLGLDNQYIGCTCQSNTVNGIHTEDCKRPKIIGGAVDANTVNGILHESSQNTQETNVTVSNNGGRGIYITIGGTLSPLRFQSQGCHFENNTGADWEDQGISTPFARTIHSTGDWVDKNSDNNLNTVDSANISHGCSITPTSIIANTNSAGIVVSITAITSTQFTVRLFDVVTGAAAGGSYTVYWQADCFNGQ